MFNLGTALEYVSNISEMQSRKKYATVVPPRFKKITSMVIS